MTRTRGRAVTLLFAALLLIPLLETLLILQIGRTVGGWPTVGALLAISALGAWLVRREGGRAWSALRSALTTGRMPAIELVDAALVLIGGVLLLTPGFFTDAVGLFFVMPFTRPLAARWLQEAVERQLLARAGVVRSDIV